MSALPTLVSLLERAGTRFRCTDIVSRRADDTTHRYTYGDFHARARALAAALQDYGVHPGDRVATLMWHHHVHLETYFGVPAIGGVLHTVDPCLPADEIVYSINAAADRLLIADELQVPVLERILHRLHVERIIVASSSYGRPARRWYDSYEELLQDGNGDPSYADVTDASPAGLYHTSCESGGPVAVQYSHGALALHAYSMSLPDNFSIGRHDTVLSAMSTAHTDAWGLPYAALMHGSRIVMPGPNLQPERVLDLLAAHDVTVMGTTPAVWDGVLDALECDSRRWQSLRGTRVIVADPEAPATTFRRLDAFGVRAIQPWALTAMTPLDGLRGALIGPTEEEWQLRREFLDWKVCVES
jgi:acyl-CoA synthetase (AMP-forming)/AMP-acid ligase II